MWRNICLHACFDGLIAEVLVYDRELKRDERRHISHYLSTKWKIEMYTIYTVYLY